MQMQQMQNQQSQMQSMQDKLMKMEYGKASENLMNSGQNQIRSPPPSHEGRSTDHEEWRFQLKVSENVSKNAKNG